MDYQFQPTHEPSEKPLITVLRWLAFLPAAVIGSLLVHVIAVVLNNIGAAMAGFDPEGIIHTVGVTWIANAVFGAAFVYIASYVAPSHEEAVAGVTAVLFIFGAGVLFFGILEKRDFVGLLGLASSVIGASWVAYAIIRGESIL